MKTVEEEKNIQNVFYEYNTVSVILTCAISGTNGSSGLGSVRREHIERSTCVYRRECVSGV